jgi:Phosphotransferase enzyme family
MTVISEREHIIASLGTFATLPDWLAGAMDGERVGQSLQRHVPELAPGRFTLRGCRPERLRAKDSEWVARYRLTVTDGEEERDVVLVGTLVPPTEQPRTGSGGGGVPAAGPWSCWLPDLRLQLHHEPSDVALPALAVLTEATATARLLEPVLHQAGYRDAVIASCEPVVVRYKPGSRCTVVTHVTYAESGERTPPSPVVLKTHQGDKGQTAWAAMTALWSRREAWQGVVRMAEPLAFLPEERILVQGPVPEELTLKELARRAFATNEEDALMRLRAGLVRTAQGLAALHRSGAVYGRTATVEDEIAEIRDVVRRLAMTVPHVGGAAEPLLSRVEELAASAPGEAVVPAHHDFRPAQVLLHEDAVGFIDFDGAAMAEPALDLGRFTAKLRDIGLSSLLFTGQPLEGEVLDTHFALVDGLCEDFLAAYQRHAEVSRDRVVLWETCDLLTGLLHAWTKVRLARLQPRLTLLLHHLGTSAVGQARC